MAYASSVVQDQIAPEGAVWSGSTLFAIPQSILRNKCIKSKIEAKKVWNKVCEILEHITQPCLYSFDPVKPHFYTVKLGFTGVYIIFLFLLKNIDCGYLLELLAEVVP